MAWKLGMRGSDGIGVWDWKGVSSYSIRLRRIEQYGRNRGERMIARGKCGTGCLGGGRGTHTLM